MPLHNVNFNRREINVQNFSLSLPINKQRHILISGFQIPQHINTPTIDSRNNF